MWCWVPKWLLCLHQCVCVCVCCSLPAGLYFLCGGVGFMVLDAKMDPLPLSMCVCVFVLFTACWVFLFGAVEAVLWCLMPKWLLCLHLCVCVCVVHCLLGFFFVRWRSCVMLGTKMAPLPSSMFVVLPAHLIFYVLLVRSMCHHVNT